MDLLPRLRADRRPSLPRLPWMPPVPSGEVASPLLLGALFALALGLVDDPVTAQQTVKAKRVERPRAPAEEPALAPEPAEALPEEALEESTEGSPTPAPDAPKAGPANASERVIDPEAIYSEGLDVTVANIDAFVTGKRGEPVRGLSRDDFRLRVGARGGERLEITHFQEVTAEDSGHVGAEPLTVVVFVDNFNMRAATRDRALKELEPELVQAMHDGAPVMLVAFDERLEVLLTLSEDPDELRGVLQRLRLRPAADARFETRERGVAGSVRAAMVQMRGTAREQRLAVSALDNLRAELRSAAETERADVDRTLDALQAVVGSLSGVPGRKALFYLSDGLAMRPFVAAAEKLQSRSLAGRNTSASEEDFMGQGGIPDNTVSSRANELVTEQRNLPFSYNQVSEEVVPFEAVERFETLAAMANSRRIGFYSVVPAPGDAASAQSREQTRSGGVELSDRREGLELLAERTAARAQTTATSVQGFAEAALAELGDYYSIGFTPPDDVVAGTFVPLDLEVGGKTTVRYRHSLIATTFEQRLGDRLVAALVLDLTDNPLELEYNRVEQTGLSNGNFTVDLQISFPIRVLELVEQDGVHRAQARVVAAALGPGGRVRDVVHLHLPLEIPDADLEMAREQFYGALVRLELPPGDTPVAIGLWDRAAARGSFVRQEVAVGGGGR